MHTSRNTNLFLDVIMVTIFISVLLYIFFAKSVSTFFNNRSKSVIAAAVTTPEQPVDKPESDTILGTPIIGSWVWKDVLEMSNDEINTILDFAEKNKINTIYLTIDHYIDLYETEDSQVRDMQLNEYENRLQTFIDNATQRGIKVEALIGNNEWANYNLQYIPQQILNFVGDYNKRHPDYKFVGAQIDIEFYNKKDFKALEPDALNYLILLDNLVKTVHSIRENGTNENLRFGVAIPPWFDAGESIGTKDSWVSHVDWKNNNKPLIEHVYSILNSIKNTYVAVLAYKDYTTGIGGSIDLAKDEIDISTKNYPNVKVVVGQETSTVDSPHTSFMGRPKKDVIHAANDLITVFRPESSFDGVAIHHLYSFMDMK